jgi:transcriptional regulator CtsR
MPRKFTRPSFFRLLFGLLIGLTSLGLFSLTTPKTALTSDPNLRLGTQLATIKVRPTDPIAAAASVPVKGAKNETVSFQVIVTGTVAYNNLDVTLSNFSGPGGSSIPAANAQLYRVGYLNITTPSDPAGSTGLWPDSLYPIGQDRYYHEKRNGTPFNLTANRNQPIWISLDIPKTAAPGQYSATFSVTQGTGGPVLQAIPINLTVWNFTLPDYPSARTTYKFDDYDVYCYHYFGGTNNCAWDTNNVLAIHWNYWHEALAHRISLSGAFGSVSYSYNAATNTVSNVDWSLWDPTYDQPGVLLYPVPGPQFNWDDPSHTWTQAETNEAIAFWKVVAAHYKSKGWFNHAFLYTFDEPGTSDFPLNVKQADAIHAADPAFHPMVTHNYAAALAGHLDIWTVIVNELDTGANSSVNTGTPSLFHQTYDPERAAGKQVWFYDSTSSGDGDSGYYGFQQHGTWADEFIDHQGVFQLVHGYIQWKYGLDGYLYYSIDNNYRQGTDVWVNNYSFARNGDGTLFYPGTPAKIGGTTQIPVPSLRLEILRQSWNDYDYMTLLKNAGQGAFVDSVVNPLVSRADTWDHVAQNYQNAREAMAAKLESLNPPLAPSNLTASAFSASQINLSWTDNSSNETGFYIERRTGAAGSFTQIATVPANTTSYQNTTGLVDGTTYYYQVRAYNTYGNSAYTGQASATTPFLAPTNLTATAISPSQINLSWNDNSQSETGYYIERKTGLNGTFALIATTASNATTFQDTGLVDNTTYYYQVRAFNSYGNSAYSNQANDTTPLAPPSTPTNLLGWSTSATQIQLSWNDTAHNEDGFIIEHSPNSPGNWTQAGAMTGPNVTTFSDNPLTADTTYYYRVKAHNSAGDSGYSNIVSATTTVWQVTVAVDDGLGTTPNTLSRALALATSGQTISFTTSVTFSLQPGGSWQPNVPQGVNMIGNCGANGPTITIDGTGLPLGSTGLVLNHNTLFGLAIAHFPVGPQLQAPGSGSGNHLRCVITAR